ncbi:MAG: hypothetical protein ACRD1Z_14215, partial [Vicinamibacteria bacterium]
MARPLDVRSEPDRARAKEALERILSSETFARSTQLRHFVRFTVQRTLSGDADEIKEYSIAVEAYGRPADFDPRADSIVRTEARRLREKLDSYYETEGRSDRDRIVFEKGSYVPAFVEVATARTSIRLWAAASAPLGLLTALSAFWFLRGREPDHSITRVAVAPFEESVGEEDRGLALAMSESILAKLTAIEGVEVSSRSSIHGVRGMSPGEFARILRADYVVGGDLRKSGDALVLTAKLFRSSDERRVWEKSYEFPWSKVFQVQDEVSAGVAEELRLTAARRSAGRTPKADAYQAYVKGRFSAIQFANTRTPAHFEVAERRLREAVD